MKVYPVSVETLFQCVGVALVFEVLRILLSYLLASEKNVQDLTKQRLDVLADIAQIKSEQLEFVKKTKLERKKLAIEKAMEKVKADYSAAAPRWKRLFRTIRYVVYGAAIVHFSFDPVAMVDKALFWPLLPFSSTCSTAISAWAVILIAGFALRHLLRSLLPFCTTATVP